MKNITFDKKLSNGRIAYERFAELQNIIKETSDKELCINFYYDGRIGKTFLFLMCCCLFITAQAFDKSIKKINTPKRTLDKMIESGILSSGKRKTLINLLKKNQPIVPVAEKIIAGIPIKFNARSRLLEDIVSRVGEILNNALEHSGAELIYIGKYRKSRRRYCFACYDPGVGIPNKVREYFMQRGGSDQLTDKKALEWAIKSGNSTVSDHLYPRGAGLSLLQNFVESNHGQITICTGKALYSYLYKESTKNCDGVFKELKIPFVGTLFEMDFVADGWIYQYKGENENGYKGE